MEKGETHCALVTVIQATAKKVEALILKSGNRSGRVKFRRKDDLVWRVARSTRSV